MGLQYPITSIKTKCLTVCNSIFYSMFLWCICSVITRVWLALIVVIATNLLLESSKRVQLNI